MDRATILNLPNSLTLIRIACIPALILLATSEARWAGLLAALVFALASATDFLDGYLARKLERVTVLGKFLDPIADKLIVSAALIMLVSLGRAPAWVVFVIIGREIAVTGLRAMAASAQGLVIQAGWWGKLKTACQMVAILALLLHYPYWGVNINLIGTLFLYAALVLTVLSGWLYFKNHWGVISEI
ncbi:MAG: CDP-diacylglycerol--glycerol-3-phosphate 3-phosphatidyltransferase [Deltaproteobacteria bacterium]|nr:CDP-diacylglycerol--glycerol-3-phosphate 3-phosphatidyltransferase [Deltaproteobacteria bacterium]